MSLEICKVCGWYPSGIHSLECDEWQGHVASQFIQRLQPLTATKLGYGYGHVNVELSSTFTVTFAVNRAGLFTLCAAGNFFLLEALDTDRAIALVQTLDAWYRHEVNPRVEPTRETLALALEPKP